MKPVQLSDNLKKIGCDDTSSAIISEQWASHAKSIIETKRKDSIAPLQVNLFFKKALRTIVECVWHKKKVHGVESSLHFQLSSQTGGQAKTPLGLLHLNLNAGPDKLKSTLSMEFSQSELLSFYHTLEQIQDQLDNIM